MHIIIKFLPIGTISLPKLIILLLVKIPYIKWSGFTCLFLLIELKGNAAVEIFLGNIVNFQMFREFMI